MKLPGIGLKKPESVAILNKLTSLLLGTTPFGGNLESIVRFTPSTDRGTSFASIQPITRVSSVRIPTSKFFVTELVFPSGSVITHWNVRFPGAGLMLPTFYTLSPGCGGGTLYNSAPAPVTDQVYSEG